MTQGKLTIVAEINDLLWLRERIHDMRRNSQRQTRVARSADAHDNAQTALDRLNALIAGMTVS